MYFSKQKIIKQKNLNILEKIKQILCTLSGVGMIFLLQLMLQPVYDTEHNVIETIVHYFCRL